MLNHQSVLITGGTGSFGRKFVELILQRYPQVRKIVVFSRDELKQYEMSQLYPSAAFPQVKFVIGDVRDPRSVRQAFDGIDVVIHAAAMKHVPVAEHNPMECIKTNILGAQNVIEAALQTNVKRLVALSTAKATAPTNLYGATKLASDKLFVAANALRGDRDVRFSVVRYGNVLGSSGSVVPFFIRKRAEGELPVTHEEMTRFHITLEEGVSLVLYALEYAWGGEVFIPKIPSFKITDLASAIGPNCKQKMIGVRPGEKLHEDMITETDALNTLEFEKYYVITPSIPLWNADEYARAFNGQWVPPGFRYSSDRNQNWLSVEDLRALIRKNFDPNFTY